MVIVGTYLNVADKSGAKIVQCIKLLRSLSLAGVGDKLVVVVKDAVPKKKKKKKFAKKSEIHTAVLTKHKRPLIRKTGYSVQFADNCVVLLKKGELTPFSNRLVGSVPRELRLKGYTKLVSMSSNVF